MAAGKPARIGLVGMGNIGSYVYEQITSQPQLGLEVAFVADTSADRLKDLPRDLVLDRPGASQGPAARPGGRDGPSRRDAAVG